MLTAVVWLTFAFQPAHATAASQTSFSDVPPDSPYAQAVQWMAEVEIATGTEPGLFSPDRSVTRGEAAVFLWRMEGQPTAILHRFADITEPWQQLPVSWMAGEGLTTGATPSTFGPDEPVTRGQMAAFLHRLAGEPPAPAHSFEDIGDPALDTAISWMAAEGITSGVGPGLFGPEQPVTRGQMAVLLYRYSGEPELTQPEEPPPPSTVASTVSVPPENRPTTLTIDQTSLRVGDLVTVAGEGANPEQNVTLSLQGQVVAEVVPLTDGTYSAVIEIPEVTPGEATLTLSQGGDVEVEVPLAIRQQTANGGSGLFYAAAVLLLVAAALAVFWKGRGSMEVEAGAERDVATEADRSEQTLKVRRSVDALEKRLADEEPRWIRHLPALGDEATIERLGLMGEGPELWAVGRAQAEGSSHAMVWASVDGSDWRPVVDLGPGFLEVAAQTRDGLVGLGIQMAAKGGDGLPKPTLWRSSDLATWSSHELLGEAFAQTRFDGVVEFDGRLFVYGRNRAGPCLWIGDERWITRQAAGPIDLMLNTGRGLFVFGRDIHDQRHVVLFTDDGQTWRSLPDLGVFDKGRVAAGTEFDGGVVVLGSDHVNECAAVWVSDDGINWLRAPTEFAPKTTIEHVVRTTHGLLAIGSARSGSSSQRPGATVFWESVDAIAWTPLEGNARLEDAFIASAVLAGSQLVCAGRSLEPGTETAQGSAAVWTLEFGPTAASEPDCGHASIPTPAHGNPD